MKTNQQTVFVLESIWQTLVDGGCLCDKITPPGGLVYFMLYKQDGKEGARWTHTNRDGRKREQME